MRSHSHERGQADRYLAPSAPAPTTAAATLSSSGMFIGGAMVRGADMSSPIPGLIPLEMVERPVAARRRRPTVCSPKVANSTPPELCIQVRKRENLRLVPGWVNERAIGAKCIHVEARHSEPKVQPANPGGFLCHNLLLLGDLCRPTPEKRLKPCSAGLPT